jgi:hypothetical protein
MHRRGTKSSLLRVVTRGAHQPGTPLDRTRSGKPILLQGEHALDVSITVPKPIILMLGIYLRRLTYRHRWLRAS